MVLECARWQWIYYCHWNGTSIPLYKGGPTGTHEVEWGFFCDQRLPPSAISWVNSPRARLNQLQFVRLLEVGRREQPWVCSFPHRPPTKNVLSVQMSAQIKNLGNTPAKSACSWDYKYVLRVSKVSGLVLCKHTKPLLPFFFYLRKWGYIFFFYLHCLCYWGRMAMQII